MMWSRFTQWCYTFTTKYHEEQQRIKLTKSLAKFSWELSKMNPNTDYINKHSGEVISFNKNVIDSALKYVTNQEATNPDWNDWVVEWSNK